MPKPCNRCNFCKRYTRKMYPNHTHRKHYPSLRHRGFIRDELGCCCNCIIKQRGREPMISLLKEAEKKWSELLEKEENEL